MVTRITAPARESSSMSSTTPAAISSGGRISSAARSSAVRSTSMMRFQSPGSSDGVLGGVGPTATPRRANPHDQRDHDGDVVDNVRDGARADADEHRPEPDERAE